jgi:hypothetical protein
MAETLSQMFIESLRDPRDRLYALALATSSTPSEAEARLIRAVRKAFAEAASAGIVGDSLGRVTRILDESHAAIATMPPPDITMPADAWARVAAAVQMEAAKSEHAQALHAESELLKPDPMLAPKKRRARQEDEEEEFELSTPRKVMLGIATVVVSGILITGYVMRTEPPPETPPGAVNTQAGTQPATQTMPASRPAGL